MSEFTAGMICATALAIATLFFRWLDRRNGWQATSTHKLVAKWRKEGGDKASLLALIGVVGAVAVFISIPRLVTITLLLRGYTSAATAMLLTGLVFTAGSMVLSSLTLKDNVDNAFSDEPR